MHITSRFIFFVLEYVHFKLLLCMRLCATHTAKRQGTSNVRLPICYDAAIKFPAAIYLRHNHVTAGMMGNGWLLSICFSKLYSDSSEVRRVLFQNRNPACRGMSCRPEKYIEIEITIPVLNYKAVCFQDTCCVC